MSTSITTGSMISIASLGTIPLGTGALVTVYNPTEFNWYTLINKANSLDFWLKHEDNVFVGDSIYRVINDFDGSISSYSLLTDIRALRLMGKVYHATNFCR